MRHGRGVSPGGRVWRMVCRTALVAAALLACPFAREAAAAEDAKAKPTRPIIWLATYRQAPLITAEGSGMLDLLLKEAFGRLGYDVRIDYLPGERAMENANLGITDGEALRIGGLSARYPNLIQVEEPLLAYEFSVFSLKREDARPDFEWLSRRCVGYLIGAKTLDQRLKGSCVMAVLDRRHLLNHLLGGHIDYMILGRLEGRHLLHAEGVLGKVHEWTPPLVTQPDYLYLHKKHAALAAALASVLRAMKAEGQQRELLVKGFEASFHPAAVRP